MTNMAHVQRMLTIYKLNQLLKYPLCLSNTMEIVLVLHVIIDQTLVNASHRLLNFEISGLDCRVILTEYRTRVHCIHM